MPARLLLVSQSGAARGWTAATALHRVCRVFCTMEPSPATAGADTGTLSRVWLVSLQAIGRGVQQAAKQCSRWQDCHRRLVAQ